MDGYKLFSSSVIGKGHIERNMPCQDYSLTHFDNGVYFAIVSDGCGRKKHSDLGSKIVCESLREKVCKDFDELYSSPIEDVKEMLNRSVAKAIVVFADENNIELDEMSSTYIFAAAKDEKYILSFPVGTC